MKTERIKSVGILLATLLIGALLGVLIVGLFHKVRGRHGPHSAKKHAHWRGGKGDWFTDKLNRIVEPDSLQNVKIKPIASWAASRIDSIEQRANAEVSHTLDSVKTKLRPILTADQWSQLEKFDQRAKASWHRHGRGKGD